MRIVSVYTRGNQSQASAAGCVSCPLRHSFTGEGDGFAFDPKNTDLFTNFKQLFPGKTRSQTIEAKNTYQSEAKIFLWAEDIGQGVRDAETQR